MRNAPYGRRFDTTGGSGPSFARARPQLSTKDLVAALRAAPRPSEPSPEAVSRIERRVFAALFGESDDEAGSSPRFSRLEISEQARPRPVLEGPVPAEYFKGITSKALTEPQELHDFESVDLRPIGQVVPLTSTATPFDRAEATSPAIRTGLSVKKAVAALAVAAMLTGGTAFAAEFARPGSLIYPIKLQVEAVRLTMARSDISRAQVLITIGRDRVGMLGEMHDATPRELALAIGELDGAGLGALDLLTAAPPGARRNALIDKLHTLALDHKAALEELSIVASPAAGPSIARSFEVAGRIYAVTGSLLFPSVTAPAPPEQPPGTAETVGTRTIKQTVTRSVVVPADPPPPPTDDPPPDDPEDPEPPPECETLGLACVKLPPVPSV